MVLGMSFVPLIVDWISGGLPILKSKDKPTAEELSLTQGEARVKFGALWKGTFDDIFKTEEDKKTYTNFASELADALYEMEKGGAAPVMFDGKVGGNGSCLLSTNDQELLIVSKTGKLSGKMNIYQDFCVVENFNRNTWTAEYYSADKNIRPTSDSPMHHAALHLKKKFQWSEYPSAALHGHALETEEKAAKAKIPCSKEETLFSTPPDTEALIGLIQKYPYPSNKIYVRKNHGFFILGRSIEDTVNVFKTKVLPYSQK